MTAGAVCMLTHKFAVLCKPHCLQEGGTADKPCHASEDDNDQCASRLAFATDSWFAVPVDGEEGDYSPRT